MVVLVTSVFTINFNISSVTTDGVPTVSLLAPVYLIPGAATISIVCLTVLSLPLVVQEFKKTNTLKRLSMYRSGVYFFTAIVLYYLILCYLSYVISFCIASLLITCIDSTDKETIYYMLANMHIGELFFSIFMYSILAIGVGILFSMVCKNQNSVQIIGIIIVLLVLFLGGAGIPLQYAAVYSNGKSGITL
jgi:cellulose synthase/poly-beta-1,6-N-acetylglucosamine synthase-like glycosyltransferase